MIIISYALQEIKYKINVNFYEIKLNYLRNLKK